MKIGEMLALVDEMKPNSVDRARKIGWLSDVDRRVFADIISRHERDESAPGAFDGYTEETDENTILLIQEPHSEIYRWFLEMQIDLANMEMGKYNNSMLLFDNAWKQFAAAYHREHMPIGGTNFSY